MAREAAARTILIVDDDDELACALSHVLEGAGYRIRRAADGGQGVRMAAEERPDLILLDFMMPVKNGFEACAEMRQIPALRNVPILAFTAFGQDIGEIHGMTRSDSSTGIQDYLEKPVEPNVLVERVRSALTRSMDDRSASRCQADPGRCGRPSERT